jgi:hypothetical protein
MERALFLTTSPVLTHFDWLFSKDDAKCHEKPLPGHYGASFAPFPAKKALCAKIPRIMREKNTRFCVIFLAKR